jgi:hypothetical protein
LMRELAPLVVGFAANERHSISISNSSYLGRNRGERINRRKNVGVLVVFFLRPFRVYLEEYLLIFGSCKLNK